MLINDPHYARFMLWQFTIGFGNMMCIPPIVLLVEDRFQLGYRDAILVTQVIPFALIPVFVGMWSALLDRWHVIRYRSVHSWVFVVMLAAYFFSARYEIISLLFLGAALRGAAFSGGAIAWNLGHNDFATDENAAQYMAVHVTLTGLRGLIAPFAGVALYQFFESRSPGGGGTTFAIAAGIVAVGAVGFMTMARSSGKKPDG